MAGRRSGWLRCGSSYSDPDQVITREGVTILLGFVACCLVRTATFALETGCPDLPFCFRPPIWLAAGKDSEPPALKSLSLQKQLVILFISEVLSTVSLSSVGSTCDDGVRGCRFESGVVRLCMFSGNVGCAGGEFCARAGDIGRRAGEGRPAPWDDLGCRRYLAGQLAVAGRGWGVSQGGGPARLTEKRRRRSGYTLAGRGDRVSRTPGDD